MKKFLLGLAAVGGVSLLTVTGTAEASHHNRGWNNHGHHHHHNQGRYAPGRGGYVPVAPVIRPQRPVILPYPNTYCPTPVYQAYPVYNSGPSFGVTTPNFGLFVR
ncbi:hypothetical protein [Planctomicrobium sp. SH664]|uniref:hypothetical protein n=1 Tax=Planctomicrobium sp. SH664 TaxID=3448125 RepID=UPI003F5BF5A9